jgi:hypothetical protein
MKPTMLRLRQTLVVLSLAFGAVMVSAPAASAAPPESGLQCVQMQPNACWAHQVVFRGDPMLEFLTWTTNKWPNGFNHDSDGCSVQQVRAWLEDHSVPWLTGAIRDKLDDYAAFFRPACRIHDFGYRNFGSGTQQGFTQYQVADRYLTENQKSWNEPNSKGNIDHRFGDLMHVRCGDKTPPSIPVVSDSWACGKVADLFESVVRSEGHID